MDHPKCRDCGTRHRLGAMYCPLYQEASKETAKKILKEVMPHTPVQPKPDTGHDKAKPHPQATEGGAKFDRNAYQREYMRAWRAKQKEKRVPSKTGP